MPRGRKRDAEARQRILDATYELVGTAGSGKVAINEIAATAGVAKQTIYRWWPSKTAVILEALVNGSMRFTPFRESVDVRADFVAHVGHVIDLLSSPTGQLIRELVAEAQSDETIATEFRERFWAPRRHVSRARLVRGIELGQVRPDIDHELVLDAIYGPVWLRFMVTNQPMEPSDAALIVDMIWPGITTEAPAVTH